MSNIYYTINLIGEEEFDEIDFKLYEEIFGDFDHDESDPTAIEVGNHNLDGYPINIDTVVDQLLDWKRRGANYVIIDYSENHIGYPMAGLNIRKSTPKEIEIEENKNLSMRSKRQKIEDLQRQIYELQEKY